MAHQSIRRRAGAAILALAILALPTASAAARTIDVKQTARLRLVRKVGTVLYEQGTASGTLPGVVSATLKVNVAKVGGEVTFYPRGGGTITFKATGAPTSAGVISKAAGSMTVVRGSGRFARARGNVRFNATLNRRNWAINVSASGRLRY
jgi:hypothetical protein